MAKLSDKIETIIVGGRNFGRSIIQYDLHKSLFNERGVDLAKEAEELNQRLEEANRVASMEFESLKESLEDFEVTNIEINNVEVYPCNHLQKLEKELKSIRKRLKRCGYIESQELREREIEVRKEIKHAKRRIHNAI